MNKSLNLQRRRTCICASCFIDHCLQQTIQPQTQCENSCLILPSTPSRSPARMRSNCHVPGYVEFATLTCVSLCAAVQMKLNDALCPGWFTDFHFQDCLKPLRTIPRLRSLFLPLPQGTRARQFIFKTVPSPFAWDRHRERHRRAISVLL